eukprot:1161059-Pelagomonas_calceolata.AAC.2
MQSPQIREVIIGGGSEKQQCLVLFPPAGEVKGSNPTLPGLLADTIPGKPDMHQKALNFPET